MANAVRERLHRADAELFQKYQLPIVLVQVDTEFWFRFEPEFAMAEPDRYIWRGVPVMRMRSNLPDRAAALLINSGGYFASVHLN